MPTAANKGEPTKKAAPKRAPRAPKQPVNPAAPAPKAAASRARSTNRAPRKPGKGKSTDLTLTRLSQIVNVIAAGNYVTTACQFVGIAENSYYRWRTRGEVEVDRVACLPRVNVDAIMESFEGKDDTYPDSNGQPMERASAEYMWNHRPRQFDPVEWPFVVFQFLVERAKAAAEIRTVQNIQKAAGQGNWQAGAWFLERTNHEKWGRKDHLHIQGATPGAPIKTENTTVITVEALNSKLASMFGDDDD